MSAGVTKVDKNQSKNGWDMARAQLFPVRELAET